MRSPVAQPMEFGYCFYEPLKVEDTDTLVLLFFFCCSSQTKQRRKETSEELIFNKIKKIGYKIESQIAANSSLTVVGNNQ